MNIEDLTIKQAREIASIFTSENSKRHSMEIGEAYFIRTVTYFYTGRVSNITDADIELSDAAWIADTGRFAEALETGSLSEIEPYPNRCYVNRSAIIDFSVWEHPLPREQK